MSVKDEVLTLLDNLRIPYALFEHEPADTMAQCARCEQVLGGLMPKNLFLKPRRSEDYYLLVMRPDRVYSASQVSRQAGASRLSFADEEALFRLLHTRPGSISPLGLAFDTQQKVTLLLDSALREQKRLLFHPCDNRYTLALSGSDFFERFLSAYGRQALDVRID